MPVLHITYSHIYWFHQKPKKEDIPKIRGRPKKGEERIKEPTRLERQAQGMTIAAMLSDLPSHCVMVRR